MGYREGEMHWLPALILSGVTTQIAIMAVSTLIKNEMNQSNVLNLMRTRLVLISILLILRACLWARSTYFRYGGNYTWKIATILWTVLVPIGMLYDSYTSKAISEIDRLYPTLMIGAIIGTVTGGGFASIYCKNLYREENLESRRTELY